MPKNPCETKETLNEPSDHLMKTHLKKDAFKSSAESLRAPFARKADKNNYFLSFFTFSLVCNAQVRTKEIDFPIRNTQSKGLFCFQMCALNSKQAYLS